MGKWRLAVAIVSVCILAALSLVSVRVYCPSIGCNGLDTSWHTYPGELHETSSARGKIEPGGSAWRFVRNAEPGETLPGGAEAGSYHVLWEWRMELTNVSDRQYEAKVKYFLVTADKSVVITSAEYPPGGDSMVIIEPGEKKPFTGQGFIDKNYIHRVAKGRGRFGIRAVQRETAGPGKETPR